MRGFLCGCAFTGLLMALWPLPALGWLGAGRAIITGLWLLGWAGLGFVVALASGDR